MVGDKPEFDANEWHSIESRLAEIRRLKEEVAAGRMEPYGLDGGPSLDDMEAALVAEQEEAARKGGGTIYYAL